METEGKMRNRHKLELRELEKELKKLKKNKKLSKAEVKEESERLVAELEERHKQELEALVGPTEDKEKEEPPTDDVKEKEDTEEPKLSKAQLRHIKRREERAAQRAQIAEERRAAIEAGDVGAREEEMVQIREKLDPKGLTVFPVPADGNCMFWAVAHGVGKGHAELRHLAATYMREHRDDFAPFLGEENLDEYCDAMESTNAWGGEPELLALARGLNVDIVVHSASMAERIVHGGEDGRDDRKTVHVSYHRRYYVLGEHYNAVVPKE